MVATDIRLLCLDFDGVVLESNSIRDAAWSWLFADQSQEMRDRIIAFHRRNPGIDRATKLQRIYSELLGDQPGNAQIIRQLALFQEYCEQALVAAPFVPGALSFFEEPDIPIAILTAARENEVINVCRRRGLDKFFSIRGGPINKTQHLRNLMVECKLEPAMMLMVGDQLSDWDASIAVGCHFVGRIAPDRPAPFNSEVPTISDLRLGWDGLKALLPSRSI